MKMPSRCLLWTAAAAVVALAGCGDATAPREKAPEVKEAGAPAAAPAAPATIPKADVYSLKVPDVGAAAVKADGVLDEAVWKKAATSESFAHDDGSKAGARTRLLVARGGGRLYVAVEAFDDEANLKSLKADVTEHDGDGIWDDDDVELFIGPAGGRTAYYQIIINPKGATLDSYYSFAEVGDTGWNPKYESAAKVGKASWVVEFSLPVGVFDRTKATASKWTFNVLRCRTATSEFMYWSPVGEGNGAHMPEKFGTLSGMPTKK